MGRRASLAVEAGQGMLPLAEPEETFDQAVRSCFERCSRELRAKGLDAALAFYPTRRCLELGAESRMRGRARL